MTGKKILILDENESMKSNLVHNLQDQGHALIFCRKKDEAMTVALEQNPDLIFVNPSHADTVVNFCQLISSYVNTRKIPLLLLASEDVSLPPASLKEIPNAEILPQTLDDQSLLNTIQSLFRRVGNQRKLSALSVSFKT